MRWDKEEVLNECRSMITQDTKREHSKYEHLDDAPIPITVCCSEGMTIQYANQRALSLLVSTKRDCLGNTISEIFPDVFPEEIIGQICRDCLPREKRRM